MPETILVTIKDGTATVKPVGFKGPGCLKATLELERALGKTTHDTPTAELRELPATLKVQA
jgi:hypothetical protein